MNNDALLTPYNRATFYGGTEKGCVDYPFLPEEEAKFMTKITRTLYLMLIAFLIGVIPMKVLADQPNATMINAYSFSFHALQGNDDLPLAAYKGKVLLIVNTASQCGFTPQYEGLEKLYETYKDRGLVLLGVPSNDFGGQEPGSSEQISHFCKLNYGVSFPMASKEIVSGDQAHPFYKWAREQEGFIGAPKWNFHKYLINRQGELVDYFHSTTSPEDSTLISEIEKLLAEPEQR